MNKRSSFLPLLLIVPWTLAGVLGAMIISNSHASNIFEGPALIASTVITLGPLLVYLALTRPLGLPFALYAVLSEFDHLFPPGPLGTLAKLGGFLVSGALLIKFLRGEKLIKPGPELYGWLMFFTWVVISLLWSYEPGSGLREIQQYVSLFALYLLITITTSDESDMRISIIAVIGAALGAAAFSLSSYGSSHFSSTESARATLFNGNRGNYIDPNHLAASLQIPFALLLIMMFRERHPILKGCYLVGCALLVIGMLVTGSRTGIIGAGCIFLYFFFRSRYRIQLSFIGVGMVALSLLIPTVWTRFGDQTSGALGGRLPIWRVAFSAFKDHWLIGNGTGTFISAYELALRKVFEPPAFFYQSIESHDIFVYAGVQFGIVGIALVAWAWWQQFRALKMIPSNDPFYDLRLALEAGTIALFIEACTLDLLTFKYLWIAFSLTAIVRATWFRRSMASKQAANPI
jgi:O-antigen ligase